MRNLFPDAVHEYSLQISSAHRRGHRTVQIARLVLGDEIWAGPEKTAERVASLRDLIAQRNAETRARPLPDDFPVFVAPFTSVHTSAGRPDAIALTMDVSDFGLQAHARESLIRECCGAAAVYLIEGPELFPPPLPDPAVPFEII